MEEPTNGRLPKVGQAPRPAADALVGPSAQYTNRPRERASTDRTHPEHGEQQDSLELGIGDDCAIFRPRPNEDLLFTTDQMIEDVHFLRTQPAPAIGELSASPQSQATSRPWECDPRFCLVALAVPANHEKMDRSLLSRPAPISPQDQHRPSRWRPRPRPENQLRRDGVRLRPARQSLAPRWSPHWRCDSLYVSGRLGKPWTRPMALRPRLALGKNLRGRATACIDLSDGLSPRSPSPLSRVRRRRRTRSNIPIARGATDRSRSPCRRRLRASLHHASAPAQAPSKNLANRQHRREANRA